MFLPAPTANSHTHMSPAKILRGSISVGSLYLRGSRLYTHHTYKWLYYYLSHYTIYLYNELSIVSPLTQSRFGPESAQTWLGPSDVETIWHGGGYAYAYVCVYIHIYIYTFIYLYMYIYIYVYIDICICIYTHTHIYI